MLEIGDVIFEGGKFTAMSKLVIHRTTKRYAFANENKTSIIKFRREINNGCIRAFKTEYFLTSYRLFNDNDNKEYEAQKLKYKINKCVLKRLSLKDIYKVSKLIDKAIDKVI